MPSIFEQNNHHMRLYCLEWNVSGSLLASGSNDKIIKLMIVHNYQNQIIQKKKEEDDDILELPIEGHNSTIRSIF